MTSTEFVYTTYIRSTQTKVWEAITNPEFTKQYWGSELTSDWKKGSTWRSVRCTDGNPNMAGTVLESSPPDRLSYTWHLPDVSGESDTSRVTFELQSIGGTVKLTVTHDKLAHGSVMASQISQGWPLVLSNLKSLLETGEAYDIFAIKGACSTQESSKEKVTR